MHKLYKLFQDQTNTNYANHKAKKWINLIQNLLISFKKKKGNKKEIWQLGKKIKARNEGVLAI